MKFFQKNLGTILAVVVFAGALYMYNTFFKDAGTVEEQNAAAAEIGTEITTLEGQLQQVTLELNLFDTPTYKALVDFTPTITPQPVGRKHPFDAVGR